MSARPRRPRGPATLPVKSRKDSEQSMKTRATLRRMQRRAARGHPLWWVLAGIAVGVCGTVAALWRNADNEPERDLGMNVPGYLSQLVIGTPASAPASAASRTRSD